MAAVVNSVEMSVCGARYCCSSMLPVSPVSLRAVLLSVLLSGLLWLSLCMVRPFPNRDSRLGPDVRGAVCNAWPQCNME